MKASFLSVVAISIAIGTRALTPIKRTCAEPPTTPAESSTGKVLA